MQLSPIHQNPPNQSAEIRAQCTVTIGADGTPTANFAYADLASKKLLMRAMFIAMSDAATSCDCAESTDA